MFGCSTAVIYMFEERVVAAYADLVPRIVNRGESSRKTFVSTYLEGFMRSHCGSTARTAGESSRRPRIKIGVSDRSW